MSHMDLAGPTAAQQCARASQSKETEADQAYGLAGGRQCRDEAAQRSRGTGHLNARDGDGRFGASFLRAGGQIGCGRLRRALSHIGAGAGGFRRARSSTGAGGLRRAGRGDGLLASHLDARHSHTGATGRARRALARSHHLRVCWVR